MSDIKPNLHIGLKQTEVTRDEFKLTIQRQNLRLLEIEEEKVRIAENIKATDKEITGLEENISKLQAQIDKDHIKI